MKQICNTEGWPDCADCGRRALSGEVMVVTQRGEVCRDCFVQEVSQLEARELAAAFGYGVRLV
ncbi:MAG: hypothetical protein IKM04_07975 [Clostridia bacterium]|nr:hypothetical protein [Clostridia bacterium]